MAEQIKESMQASLEYARLQTAYFSKSFYLSATLLPKEIRWDTYALYGFCRYVDNIIDNPRNRTAAQLKEELAYLEKELLIAYEKGESEHPVIKPFIWIAQKHLIPPDYPRDLIKGVEMDLYRTEYKDFDDLYIFCYRVAAVVGLMMSHIIGYKSEKALEYAENLGIAMQLTNILRDIQEDKDLGRIYLPQQELHRFDISKDDLLQERMSEALRRFMIFQVERAEAYFDQADKGIPLLTQEAQFAIYSASKIYRRILKKIKDNGYNPFKGRVYVKKRSKLGIVLQEVVRTRVLRPVSGLFT